MQENNRILNVLVACEESQRVCSEFRKLGHNAYSCDLISCSGGHPEWHFKGDALEVIKNKGGMLEVGYEAYIDGEWDIMICHPPCTFLSASGACWYYHPDDKDLPIEERRPHPLYPNRKRDRENAVSFFMALVNSDIKHIAVENPVGIMSSRYRKPDQIIQPYMFGDPFEKKTCLWLKDLPLLKPTNIVAPPPRSKYKSGCTMPTWYANAPVKERKALRSKTFQGIAEAIATQYSEYVLNEENNYGNI